MEGTGGGEGGTFRYYYLTASQKNLFLTAQRQNAFETAVARVFIKKCFTVHSGSFNIDFVFYGLLIQRNEKNITEDGLVLNNHSTVAE